MDDQPRVIHVDTLDEKEGRYPAPFDTEGLSWGKDLGRAAGSRTLGAWHERVPAGCRTSRLHAHRLEEELVYVLTGTPVLVWQAPGGSLQRTPLRAGSFVSLPAGTGLAHSIENPGPEEATLFVVGERRPGEQVVYPNDPDLEDRRRELGVPRRWVDAFGSHEDAVKVPARIETERLLLRGWDPCEIDEIVSIVDRNRAHLLPWMPWAAPDQPQGAEHYRDLVETWSRGFTGHGDMVYRVGRKDGRFVGGGGYHHRVGPGALELGYWVDQDLEGQGFVTEWVAAQTRVAFACGYDRVEIHHDLSNTRSSAVPERLGFKRDAVLRRRSTNADGILQDKVVWSLFANEQSDGVASARCRAWDWTGRRLL